MLDNKILILKTVVGSQAHGLANKDSDFDYRGVFAYPTEDILSIHSPKDQTSWIEGKEDDTSWEVGKFLMMALKCNPTVLETFLAPSVPLSNLTPRENDLARDLRGLFTHVWNSNDVKNAFIGYGLNQRKKFLDNKDGRSDKYATAYLRVLYNAWELLTKGTFSVMMKETPIFEDLKRFKSGNYKIGEVIQLCFEWETNVLKAYKENPDKQSNEEPVNEYLLKLRRQLWKTEQQV